MAKYIAHMSKTRVDHFTIEVEAVNAHEAELAAIDAYWACPDWSGCSGADEETIVCAKQVALADVKVSLNPSKRARLASGRARR